MNKAEKIVLIIAGLSLIFFIASTFFPLPEEDNILQIIMYIPIIPILVAIFILVQHRSDKLVPLPLRIIGIAIFILWILSFFIENPFR